jgi:hypothetical protein
MKKNELRNTRLHILTTKQLKDKLKSDAHKKKKTVGFIVHEILMGVYNVK